MTALLLKDIMTMWKSMKVFFLLIFVFAVVPSDFQNRFAILYAALLPYTAFAYDERSRWNRMAAMLPYSDRDIVMSKYVLGWLGAAAALVLTLILRFAAGQFGRGEFHPAELVLSFFGALLVMSVMLPAMFRFGVEKSRVIMILAVMLICGAAAGLSTEITLQPQMTSGTLPFGIAAVLAAAASAASLRLSVRLYGRRND